MRYDGHKIRELKFAAQPVSAKPHVVLVCNLSSHRNCTQANADTHLAKDHKEPMTCSVCNVNRVIHCLVRVQAGALMVAEMDH